MTRAKRVLILGGTRFAGRHIADAFLRAGARVTFFNRGLTDPSERQGIAQVHGDRARDLHVLDGGRWDAVVDTSGYTPDVVERSVRFFESRARRYLFISSISVYDFERTGPAPVDEDAPVLALPRDADRTVMVNENYGALKALCEGLVVSTFRHRATVLRPGLIVGPYDPTDRFTYWPMRIAAGGDVLVPPPAEPIQYIDARDLANFAVRVMDGRSGTTYNVVVPPGRYSFGNLMDAAARVSASGARFHWASENFLRENEVQAWGELPLWIPRSDYMHALANASSGRALVAGLEVRPLIETVQDTLNWAKAHRRMSALRAGLSSEREAALLTRL